MLGSSANEIDTISSNILNIVEEAYKNYVSGGVSGVKSFLESHRQDDGDDDNIEDKSSGQKQQKEDYQVRGDPREYQQLCFDICKARNTIVSLGTGQGKTLIALLSMRHFFKEGKKIWFLVPSIALALQQAETIESNLPLKVGVCVSTASSSDVARASLANSDVIVATHGSAIDLLRHYPDNFSLQNASLLVFDECHYATKKHNYAKILQTFYHTLPLEQRPRIIGLTASPLINVKGKHNTTPENLEKQLCELEMLLDSSLISSHSLSSSGNDNENIGLLNHEVDEQTIYYQNDTSIPVYPIDSKYNIHKTRTKELNQLFYLLEELGPRVTYLYVDRVVQELSRNDFDGESANQYEDLLRHLCAFSRYCEQYCGGNCAGRSSKLLALEDVLYNLFLHAQNKMDTIGIVFVERRITAIALQNYFVYLSSQSNDNQNNNDLSFIKSEVLTRKHTQIFKYLDQSHKVSMHESYEDRAKKAEDEWLHTVKDIRKILNNLRNREINLLISTSVVEEGIDIDACSFVIVLDKINTTKSYIQMKGRARCLNAKFYAFHKYTSDGPKMLTLEEAKETESLVTQYIGTRSMRSSSFHGDNAHQNYNFGTRTSLFTNDEEKALVNGEYRSQHGIVDISSSKSLINRYVSCIKRELHSRNSREAHMAYMPIYEHSILRLPSHLPEDVRIVYLPLNFITSSKKTNHSRLALMACVRLHKMNLLNDRLLPLKQTDILNYLMKITLSKISSVNNNISNKRRREGKTFYYVYPIRQHSATLEQNRRVLKSKGQCLCMIMKDKIIRHSQESGPIFSFSLNHSELGKVQVKIGKEIKMELTEEQWRECIEFYTIIMNSRWRRRTGRLFLKYDENCCVKEESSSDSSSVCTRIEYVIGSMMVCSSENNGHYTLDFDYMKKIIHDAKRNENDRQNASSTWSAADEPRLCAPLYSPNTTYIVFGPSSLIAESKFPNPKYASFKDYYLQTYRYNVEPESQLFHVQRSWDLPTNLKEAEVNENENENETMVSDDHVHSMMNQCHGIKSELVLLPRTACIELPLADPSLFLEAVMLPQILYKVNSYITSLRFIQHCSIHLPVLHSIISSLDLEYVVTILTAKSCAVRTSYDRYEYLGDAVLKLIQTDALIHSNKAELKNWIKCLHEGDLSSLRSGMGSNERLNESCTQKGILKFILTKPLSRGLWTPNGMKRYMIDSNEEVMTQEEEETFKPSNKTRADVVEAILGLVYECQGYEKAGDVAKELGLSLSQNDSDSNIGTSYILPSSSSSSGDSRWIEYTDPSTGKKYYSDGKISVWEKPNEPDDFAASFHNEKIPALLRDFLGFKNDKIPQGRIIQEAFTHPTLIHSKVPCYQRLEWIGDAVLCLAARSWVYKNYPNLQVKDMVLIETVLVCNETLSYLGFSKDIHKYILHCDKSLPKRLDSYAFSMAEMKEFKLWYTDPPKIISDVVESLLGASHSDCGFEKGQDSALEVISPITKHILSHLPSQSSSLKDENNNIRLFDLIQPKQMLYVLLGSESTSISTHVFAGNNLSQVPPNCPIWDGQNWSSLKDHINTNNSIAQIRWNGVNILTIAQSSGVGGKTVAKNRISGLLCSILIKYPGMLEKMIEVSSSLMKTQ